MKKEDLRASLDRIRPREELIASTLTQMADVRRHEAEKKEKFVFATPAFSRSVRLAGAFCAFALVFCIGFVVARQSNLDPVGNQPTPVDSRVGGELDTSNVNNPNLALFTIEDQGHGLSEEALKHIFDKFYQEDSSHKQEGSGLGLALVKRILTIEKGQITAENIHEGGCRFTVILRTK